MISLVRNFNKLLLAALLVGAAGTALAGTPCGTNLEYEIVGTTLVLTSPNPAVAATIDASAFKDKTFSTSFTKVIIPENVTQINSAAFYGCSGLTEVVIPPNVTLIGESAFYGCSSLVSVLCRPTTAPALGNDAFTGCHASLLICVPTLGAYSDTDWDTSYGTKLTLCFLDENDEQATTAEQIKHIRDTYHLNYIDIFRTLRKAGSFNTLTLPFSVPDIESSPLTGAEVYTFSSATVEDGTLQLEIEKVTSNSLTAGVPYLIQWPNTGEVLNHMHFSDITWDNDQSASTVSSTHVNYVGFYGMTQIDDDENHSNLFLKGNNTLYWPAEGDESKMLGFRAYFHVVNTSGPSLAPLYRGMPASLRIKATPTDIENVQQDEVSCRKELRNGQLVIIRNGETFSINGQKL